MRQIANTDAFVMFNFLPDGKILDHSKLNAFAENKCDWKN